MRHQPNTHPHLPEFVPQVEQLNGMENKPSFNFVTRSACAPSLSLFDYMEEPPPRGLASLGRKNETRGVRFESATVHDVTALKGGC